jgi:non-specific protein-tyrosine kinase
MKLKKAMEKAKKVTSAEAAPDTDGPIDRRTEGLEGNGPPPVYVDSKCCTLDNAGALSRRCVCLASDTPVLDFYKVLRTRILQHAKPKGWNTLMVTSPRPGEGKTLTAINLALTIAKAFGQTALLVDCDFHQQQIHRYLGLESDRGIVDYLLDGVPLNELIIWPKIDKLTLISGGRTISESAELLGSQRMKDLVMEMKTRYGDRYVIFDVPPVLSGADALTFSQLVDGIIMVVEEGRTPIKEVDKALDLMPKEKFLGFVLNKAGITQSGYYSYKRRADK